MSTFNNAAVHCYQISLETVTDERSHLQQDLSLSNKAASQLQADLDASVARAAALEAEMLSQNDEHVTQLTRQIGENDELCSLKNSLEEQVQGLELEKEVRYFICCHNRSLPPSLFFSRYTLSCCRVLWNKTLLLQLYIISSYFRFYAFCGLNFS